MRFIVRIITIIFLIVAPRCFAQIEVDYDTSSLEPSRTGVQITLYIHYDGDNVHFKWEAIGEDTCRLLKEAVENKQQRRGVISTSGYLFHKGKYHSIYDGSSNVDIIKKGHKVRYFRSFNRIPVIIDGVDSIEFRFDKQSIDSIVFTYTGKEKIDYPKPTPFLHSNDTIIWRLEDVKIENKDTVVFKIVFRGTIKDFLAFSKYTLQEKNRDTDLLNGIWVTIPFWLLWIFSYSYRNHLVKVVPELYNSISLWIPICTGFYMVSFISEIFYNFKYEYIREYIYSKEVYYRVIGYRLIGLLIACILIIFTKYWKKNNSQLWVVFLKKLIAVFGYSIVAYVALGLINYMAGLFLPSSDRFTSLTDKMSLLVYLKYPYGLLIPGAIFFVVCIYKLFSFERTYKYITLGFVLFFFSLDIFYTIDGLDKIDVNGTTITGLFLAHGLFFMLVPLLLSIALLTKLNKQSIRSLVVSCNLFTLLFCCYCVSSMFNLFLYLPITFIVAHFLSEKVLIANGKQRFKLAELKQEVFKLEKEKQNIFTKLFEVREYEKLREKYKKRFLAGDFTPSEFDNNIQELEEKINFNGDAKTRTLILRRMEFGKFDNDVDNALDGLYYAFFISFIILAFYFKVYQLSNPYIVSEYIWTLVPLIKYLVAGFCLGYFFPYIKGNLGWKKGMYFGVAISIAELPYAYLMSENTSYILFASPLMKEILIMTLVGFVAFDLRTIKKIYSHDFKLKYIAQVEGWKNITALTSIIVAAIVAGITTWLTNNTTAFLDMLFHNK